MRIPGPKSTLTLQRATETFDSMGGTDFVWSTLSTIKGFFYAQSGNELIEYDKKTVRITHKFICDIQKITPVERDRFLDKDGKIYEILFADDMQGVHLEISCLRRET